MELYNAKIFVIARFKVYGLTIGKYYQVHNSHQHFDDKCFKIIDDNGNLKDYNISCFECI
jgi:hypothetical protein